MPSGVTAMKRQKIAVLADEGVRFFLKEYGFNFTVITRADLNNGKPLTGYDVFVHSGWSYLRSGLNPTGKATLSAFFAAGGDYVGIGPSGADISIRFNLPTVSYKTGSPYDNGIVKITYDPLDTVTSQYPADSYGFVYGPVWFTKYPADAKISAYINGDAQTFFIAGFWTDWKKSGANGQAVVLHGSEGASKVVLIGIDPTFRAHPEFTFRILANAIYGSL